MLEVELKAGDIFTWQNYPLFMDEFKSQRWLLYLGHNSIQALVYQISTTTQYQHYISGGGRTGHNYFKMPAGTGGLTKESILDFYFFEYVPETLLNQCKADITKTGSLNQDVINKFIKHLKIDTHISKIIKRDISGYLRTAGFKVTYP